MGLSKQSLNFCEKKCYLYHKAKRENNAQKNTSMANYQVSYEYTLPLTYWTLVLSFSGSEDWHFPRIKIKPPQGLQMSVENIYHTTSWVKLMDKVILPPMNFPLDCLELKLIWLTGSVLATAPVRLNERYLLSLVPDQGCPRVVDGGQFRLWVLGEEKGLLAPPKWGRGLPAQGTCGHPT